VVPSGRSLYGQGVSRVLIYTYSEDGNRPPLGAVAGNSNGRAVSNAMVISEAIKELMHGLQS
jgi:hypothetical protein